MSLWSGILIIVYLYCPSVPVAFLEPDGRPLVLTKTSLLKSILSMPEMMKLAQRNDADPIGSR